MSHRWIRSSNAIIVAVAGLAGLATAGAEAKVLDIDKFKLSVTGHQQSSFAYSYADPEGSGSCVGSGSERVEFSTPAPVKVRAALVRYRGTKRALWSFGRIARSGLGDPDFAVPGQLTRNKQFQGSYSEDQGTCSYDGAPVDCGVSGVQVGWELALLGGSSSVGTDESVILGEPTGAERPTARAPTDVECGWPAEIDLFAYPHYGGTVSAFFIESDRQISAAPIRRVFKDSVKRLSAAGSYTLSGAPPTTFGDDSGQARGEWRLDFKRVGKPDRRK